MSEFQKLILKDYSSLGVGGAAERGRIVSSTDEAMTLMRGGEKPNVVLGYGSNSVISDQGLSGIVWLMHGGSVSVDQNMVIADAGCWWDDVVRAAIDHKLWGLELMSAIPGSVGAAVVGNIAAYGQAVADTLLWAELYDTKAEKVMRLHKNELKFGYRQSCLQNPDHDSWIVLRVCFELSTEPTKDVTYQTILNTAEDHGYDLKLLAGRRQATLDTRAKADSLYDFRHPSQYAKTAGSFFRNPEVDRQTAEHVMSFDESGLSLERLRAMNQVHSGGHRVSAAHVLLAAGFHRGQTWNQVRLNQEHILKLENIGNATAQEIFDVSSEIVRKVKDVLGIELVPEVRFLGHFDIQSAK